MEQKPTIRKTIQYRGIEVQLLEANRSNVPYESVANIRAVDSTGKTIWTAEPPVPRYEFYYTIYVDAARNVLIAITGGGYKHVINLDNGKIIESYLVK